MPRDYRAGIKEPAITKALMYQEASATCRNYSMLTMRVRTISQSLLAVISLGIGTLYRSGFLNDDSQSDKFDWNAVLWVVGLIFVALAISLGLIDWHYQSAFSAIRDSLAKLEVQAKIDGPWRAHLRTRGRFEDQLASYFPFYFMAGTGIVVILDSQFSNWTYNLLVILFCFGLFALQLRWARKRNRRVRMEIEGN